MAEPVFIVGQRRSGTTLLRRILDSHPKVAMPGEFNFAVSFDPTTARLAPDQTYTNLLYDRVYWQASVNIPFSGDPAEDMRATLNEHARRSNATVVGGVVHDRPARLLELWPSARFVHLVRDPRDVTLSSHELGISRSAYAVASSWAETERAWTEIASGLRPSQFVSLRYEDLISHPSRELRRVCDLLEIDIDDLRIEPSLLPQRLRCSSISRRRVLWAVELPAGRLMRQAGYSLAHPQLGSPSAEGLDSALGRLMRPWKRLDTLRTAVRRHGLLLVSLTALARRLRLRRAWRMTRLALSAQEEHAMRVRAMRSLAITTSTEPGRDGELPAQLHGPARPTATSTMRVCRAPSSPV